MDYHGPISVYDIAQKISAKIAVEHETISKKTLISDVKNIEDAEVGDITCVNNKKYVNYLSSTKASACIIDKNLVVSGQPDSTILLKVDNAYFAYSKVIPILYSEIKSLQKANISDKSRIGENVFIGINTIIEDNVKIGNNCIIDHNVVIKNNVTIDDNTKIGAGSYIAYAQIGKNTIIHPGVKIGTDGFGFATYNGIHHKILHIGSVIIGNNVEVGAGSTIDRGSTKDTIIGDYTIIDNLVQIGHNVEIGKGCIIIAQVGIAGSTKLGHYVAVGGQTGIAGHLKIADQVQIAGKSGVISDINIKGQIVGGYPSQPIRDWHKQTILLRKMLNAHK